MHRLPGRNIPESSGLVRASCQQILAIGREGHASNLSRMSGKLAKLLPCSHVPQPGCLIRASCRQVFAIGREGDTVHLPGVADERDGFGV